MASYHKAKADRAEMARELEAAQGEISFLAIIFFFLVIRLTALFCRPAAVAARVPQLEEDLRAARAQCAESEKAVKAAAIKARETEGELVRLRRLEANHLAELDSVKRVE